MFVYRKEWYVRVPASGGFGYSAGRPFGRWKKTKEIAGELHLSVKTVEYYREQIKRKLNLKDGAELTQYATAWVQREVPA